MVSRKKKNVYSLLKPILYIALILVMVIFAYINHSHSSLYSNIGIDNRLLNILYFDVGQADSTLITVNDYTMLIDTGNESDGAYIADFLKAQNIGRIDYLIVTHFDEDHVGGAYKIIENLDIGIIYTPNSIQESKAYSNIMEAVRINNIDINNSLQASDEIQYKLRKCKMEGITY